MRHAAALVVLASFALVPAAAAAAPPVKVAVTPLRLPRSMEAERTRIEEGAAKGLGDAGLNAQVGDGSGCDYAVTGALTRTKDQFSIRMTLVRISDAAELDAMSRNCRDEYDLCPPTPEIARDLAGRLGKRLVLDLANGSLPAPATAPPPLAPPPDLTPRDAAGAGGAAGATITTPAPEPRRKLVRNLAIAGAAVSALAIVAGAVLYFGYDGKETDCGTKPDGTAAPDWCGKVWDLAAISAILAGAGIAGAGASGWYLWRNW